MASPTECNSTEDMLAAIDEVNCIGSRPSGQVCVSLDAVGLYPSLEKEETSSICADMVVNSGVYFEAINWEEAGLYLMLTGETNGIAEEVLPSRKFSSGARPGITTYEVLQGPLVRNPETSKFDPPRRRPNPDEAKSILKNVMKKGIYTVMSSHTYKWNGEYRLQGKGGGIGDKLAQAAARIYMIWWDNQFLLLITNAGLIVSLFKRYVDDGNILCPPIDKSLEWDKVSRSLVRKSSQIEDESVLSDQSTARVLKDIADSVTDMLVWTADFPSAHESGKLPVLDICTWTVEKEEGTYLEYEFYTKPIANPVTIPAESAVPKGMKIATYRQEVLRVLSNTSHTLPWVRKAELLSDMAMRMKVSGYGTGFIVIVLNGGIRAYLKVLADHQQSGRPLHRPKDWEGRVCRRKTRDTWYQNEGGNSLY